MRYIKIKDLQPGMMLAQPLLNKRGDIFLPFEVRNVVFVIPFFVIDYFWELINLEFLIFGRMGIIEDPLLKGNISADKIKKPADLFMLVLNK